MTETRTPADMRRDLDERRARREGITPGPWRWTGYTKGCDLRVMNDAGLIVMDFDRWGMQSAQPRFRVCPHGMEVMHTAKMMLATRTACSPEIVGVDHPDAAFIAAAPTDLTTADSDVERLLARVEELERDANTLRAALEEVKDELDSSDDKDIWIHMDEALSIAIAALAPKPEPAPRMMMCDHAEVCGLDCVDKVPHEERSRCTDLCVTFEDAKCVPVGVTKS